jgi:hypothetical protein
VRDEQEQIRRKLDEVVGTEFDERGRRWGGEWFRHSIPRWIAGVLVGIAMAALVWEVLDRHLKAAHHAAQPKGPVIIDIIPSR